MATFKTFTKLLLVINLPVFGYLLANTFSRFMFVTTDSQSCRQVLINYQNTTVSDNLLEEVMNLCSREDTSDIDSGFNFSYFKQSLRNFNCPQSWKYLTVPRPLVALASYQGSGNTWTRELLETVTGLHTGSVYKDWNFVGSKLCPARGKTFVIKTHLMNNETRHPDCFKMGVSHLSYSKAIYILRNPYNAVLAEFNRKNAQKPPDKSFFNRGEGIAPINAFRNGKWNMFLKLSVDKWSNKTLYWLGQFDKPVHVLVYERLKENIISELYNLTKFLNTHVPFNSLYCLFSNTTGNYHRVKPKWMTIENLYNKKMRKMVNAIIKNVNAIVGVRRNVTDALHSYLKQED